MAFQRVNVISSSLSTPQLMVPSPVPFTPSSSSSSNRKLRGTGVRRNQPNKIFKCHSWIRYSFFLISTIHCKEKCLLLKYFFEFQIHSHTYNFTLRRHLACTATPTPSKEYSRRTETELIFWTVGVGGGGTREEGGGEGRYMLIACFSPQRKWILKYREEIHVKLSKIKFPRTKCPSGFAKIKNCKNESLEFDDSWKNPNYRWTKYMKQFCLNVCTVFYVVKR